MNLESFFGSNSCQLAIAVGYLTGGAHNPGFGGPPCSLDFIPGLEAVFIILQRPVFITLQQ